MDTLTPEQRHLVMSRIRGTDTNPERQIRSALFRMGFRFRKNDRRLEGKPDIVLPHYNAVIFVNGCFWHGHKNCKSFRLPKTNTEYWQNKILKNIERDKRQTKNLIEQGWRVGLVWECSILGKQRAQKIRAVSEEICYWLEERPADLFMEF